MRLIIKVCLIIIVATTMVAAKSQNQPNEAAKAKLSEGTAAYNRGDYRMAETLFQSALAMDGKLPKARLFYAASIRAQYLPGDESEENVAIGKRAIKAYQDLIINSSDNRDIDAAHAFIAEIYKGLGQLEEHRNWLLKRGQLPGQTDEVRAQIYYMLGVTYWEEAYRISQKYQLPHSQPPAFKPARKWDVDDVEKARSVVLHGLTYLEEAIQLNPKYANHYSYRALLYREQAKLESDRQIVKDLLNKADQDLVEFQRLNREAVNQNNANDH